MVPRRLGFNVYQVGTAVALLSISSFFMALILVYFLTFHQHPEWGHIHVPATLWASTMVVIASSISLERARFFLWRGMLTRHHRQLNLTVALGTLFLVLQAWALTQLMQSGVYLQSNPQGSVYYVFTGIHGAHLFGGLIWFWFLLRRLRAVRPDVENDLRRQRYATGAASLYWHFISVLWLILFGLLLAWS